MKKFFLFILVISTCVVLGQNTSKRALFLGNSYTYGNNLPQMVAEVALSVGDTLVFDSNTPGGYTLQGHSTNPTTLAKIASGNWDYVVLQEQSQLPSFPINQVETEVFPYAKKLDSIINAENSCVETVFFMTWGRKNGDASNCANWPPVCTYEGMDSLLNLRYRMMADSNEGIVSPVGAVWKYIRQNHPQINLYQPDESHPSVAGTYAAACTFYTAFFRKDPSNIAFNSSLSPVDAENIRAAAKLVVYDSLLNWHIGEYDPVADFSFVSSGWQVNFTNISQNATSYFWDFGDGTTSTDMNPVHIYPVEDQFLVTLVVEKCGYSDTLTQSVTITIIGVDELHPSILTVYPNPVSHSLSIDSLPYRMRYKIVNISGQEMQAGAISNSENRINVSSLTNGVYFLQLEDGIHTYAPYKFIKSGTP
jgi:PKD repeat protein